MGIKNENFIHTTGIAPEKFKNALEYAHNINPRTTTELHESLRKGGYGELVPYFGFNENHEVKVFINGIEREPDSIEQTTERSSKKIPPKPRQLTRQESLDFFRR